MDSPRMEQASSSTTTITNPMQGVAEGGGPAPPDDQQPKRPPHLSIDIPAATSAPLTPTAAAEAAAATPGSNASRTPGSGSASGSGKPPAPQRTPSFKLRQTVRSLLPGGGSFKSSVRGYEASLSRLFSGRIARTASLPAADEGALSASVHAADKTPPSAPAAADKTGMHRSQSLPLNMKKLSSAKSIKRMNSLGGVYRVVPSTPRAPAAATAATSNAAPDIVPTEPGAGEEEDDHGEDIAEEEAVCRICMVELSEGGGAMKLECSCRGELALAHTDCALKWFGIKGTRTCEVCKEEVQNLPVTLLRVQSTRGGEASRAGAATGTRYVRYRISHGTPILVIISILAYFCFLEQLLVAHNGFAALAVSLPFSCILGLFSSLTTTSMGTTSFNHCRCDGNPRCNGNQLEIVRVCNGEEIRVDLRDDPVPLRRVLHPSVLQISASAGCDIHHPGHLRRFRHGDDRQVHHHRSAEVEDNGPGPAAPCSQATTCRAAAAGGSRIWSTFRPAVSRW